jgi:hypothetical protein
MADYRISNVRFGIGRDAYSPASCYSGMADIHEQAPGGEYTESVTCSHRHPDEKSARACGRVTAQAAIAERNSLNASS